MALMQFGRKAGGAATGAAPAPAPAPAPATPQRQQAHASKKGGDRVLLELFVMSECPDANYCEHVFGRLLETLNPIVTLRTQYIQQADGGKITCKHGDTECAGNLAQLCLQAHTPRGHNYDWFAQYLLCTWDSGKPPGSAEGVKFCLDKVGVSGEPRRAIDRCIHSREGAGLMRASASEVSARGVVNSCTVAVEGARRCVRDGGQWRDCPGGWKDADFVKSLCGAYKEKTGRDAPACGVSAATADARAA